MEEIAGLEWDENKRISNIAKHSLDFFDALSLLQGRCLHREARSVNEEVRHIAIGILDDVYVSIIYTLRGSVIRIISMRKARRDEQRHHQAIFGG